MYMSAICYSEFCYPGEGWVGRWLEHPLPQSKKEKLNKSKNRSIHLQCGGEGWVAVLRTDFHAPRTNQKTKCLESEPWKGHDRGTAAAALPRAIKKRLINVACFYQSKDASTKNPPREARHFFILAFHNTSRLCIIITIGTCIHN